MADFPFDIVGFDLDGTLIDTSGDLTHALNHALTTVGRPSLARERVVPMIGGGARHMLAQAMAATGGFTEAQLQRLYYVLLEYYEANIAVDSAPFPGAMEAIDTLEARGAKVAVVTNKLESLARKLLRELGILDRFACVIGGDTLGPGRGKPHRDPIDDMVARCGGGRAVFVGDSIYDTEAARNAGIPSVAVSFGFLMQPVSELGADAVIDRYRELVPTLERLGQRRSAQG